jgi:hypothetical protein
MGDVRATDSRVQAAQIDIGRFAAPDIGDLDARMRGVRQAE